jgi:hypothetical protein
VSTADRPEPGLFRALRAFYLRDDETGINALVEKGCEVKLADARLISDLFGLGKIEAADKETAGRLKTQDMVTWTKAHESLIQPVSPLYWDGHRW